MCGVSGSVHQQPQSAHNVDILQDSAMRPAQGATYIPGHTASQKYDSFTDTGTKHFNGLRPWPPACSQESHCTPVQAVAFNALDPLNANLVATVGGDQATVYDDLHMGDFLSVVVHFVNRRTAHTEGGVRPPRPRPAWGTYSPCMRQNTLLPCCPAASTSV